LEWLQEFPTMALEDSTAAARRCLADQVWSKDGFIEPPPDDGANVVRSAGLLQAGGALRGRDRHAICKALNPRGCRSCKVFFHSSIAEFRAGSDTPSAYLERCLETIERLEPGLAPSSL
jgi:hypothetical protein